MRSRRGFSFIELLTVMIVIGILASIAILRYRDFTNEALAARIATDMETIRLAALNHYSETSTWPAETADGQMPAELVRYLPDGWRFGTGSYTLTFAPPPIPGDFDVDGDVDDDDLAAFESCASAPGVPRAAGCENRDFDTDSDVDQTDFAAFQRCYSGENVAPNPNCAP